MSLLQTVTLQKLLILPIHLLAVFSWSKSFKNNLVLGNYTLNRLGLHVFRLVLSHGLFAFRLWLLSPLAAAEDRKTFRDQGYLLKENFLPQDEFQALKEELYSYQGKIRELKEGNTITQRVFLTNKTIANLPMCSAFIANRSLLRLMRYTSSKNRIPFFYAENLKHGILHENGEDPQKHTHTDVFFPSVKAWLFIDDVSEQNGPFNYVPGSHRLTWRRIRWEYAESLKSCLNKKRRDSQRYWDGSFRVTDEALHEMGLSAPKPFKVPANTLVIANVHGFHKRGNAEANTSRMSIWMQSRDNPFDPFIIVFPKLTAKAYELVWSWFSDRRDTKMQREGKLAYVEGRFSATTRQD